MARLLAAIKGNPVGPYWKRLGLPVHSCPQCGKEALGDPKWKCFPCCSITCQKQYDIIQVECEECGVLFPRRKSNLIYRIGKRGQKHTFCSRHCFGKWVAKSHGFLARFGPEVMVNSVCPCGRAFRAPLKKGQVYCSRGCFYRSRERKKALTCAKCGKVFQRVRSLAVKSKLHYCSQECWRMRYGK